MVSFENGSIEFNFSEKLDFKSPPLINPNINAFCKKN